MCKEEMENDINERNFKDRGFKVKVLNGYVNKKNNLTPILMEVQAEVYKIIKENNKIFIGYQCCKVYDSINITPCINCGRLGHNGMKCIHNRSRWRGLRRTRRISLLISFISAIKKQVSLLVCVVCEDAYHVADFKRFKNAKQISHVLILCPAHSELQLNFKSGDLLSVEARQIIAQVKLYERKKYQEQLLNTISTEVLTEDLERQNLTIVGQDEEDFHVMKAEIMLQKS